MLEDVESARYSARDRTRAGRVDGGGRGVLPSPPRRRRARDRPLGRVELASELTSVDATGGFVNRTPRYRTPGSSSPSRGLPGGAPLAGRSGPGPHRTPARTLGLDPHASGREGGSTGNLTLRAGSSPSTSTAPADQLPARPMLTSPSGPVRVSRASVRRVPSTKATRRGRSASVGRCATNAPVRSRPGRPRDRRGPRLSRRRVVDSPSRVADRTGPRTRACVRW